MCNMDRLRSIRFPQDKLHLLTQPGSWIWAPTGCLVGKPKGWPWSSLCLESSCAQDQLIWRTTWWVGWVWLSLFQFWFSFQIPLSSCGGGRKSLCRTGSCDGSSKWATSVGGENTPVGQVPLHWAPLWKCNQVQIKPFIYPTFGKHTCIFHYHSLLPFMLPGLTHRINPFLDSDHNSKWSKQFRFFIFF